MEKMFQSIKLNQDESKDRRYVLTNSNGVKATFLPLGCTLASLTIPNGDDEIDVCLGYDQQHDYFLSRTYFGAVCGRYANRIAGGRFEINGTEYQLSVNDAPNHIHGGILGFSHVIWNVESYSDQSITFSRLSPDGEESYPGNLNVTITYTLTDSNILSFNVEAISDQDTILNLTNHTYWNLNGHDSGTAMNHVLTIPAHYYCPCDAGALVTGEIEGVQGTPFDFRVPKSISPSIEEEHIQLQLGKGFDHCYLLDNNLPIVLKGNLSGIEMSITTDLPAVQLYTANHIHEEAGKNGVIYHSRNAVCLETEQVPDAPNKPQFPSALIHAGQLYTCHTDYHFHF